MESAMEFNPPRRKIRPRQASFIAMTPISLRFASGSSSSANGYRCGSVGFNAMRIVSAPPEDLIHLLGVHDVV